jgi:hypothetical protein
VAVVDFFADGVIGGTEFRLLFSVSAYNLRNLEFFPQTKRLFAELLGNRQGGR